MKKILLLFSMAALMLTAKAQTTEFETASQAVVNMGLGWNLGNTLECNSGDVSNMWIEYYDLSKGTAAYETAWGEQVTTQALIHMFKDAGFGAVRVPVTWYPHMGISTNGLNWDKQNWNPSAVNAAWMARVKQVVDYVINEGMYCILNVHHDTGTSSTAWIHASMSNYNSYNSTFTTLWTEIANTFKNYDEHLIFEGYNEVLDNYNSWCYASKDANSNSYDASSATDSYNAINAYANAFVSAVRATGGNNTTRNLLINTYCCCSGLGNWSSHLVEPLANLTLPTDPCGNQNHLIAGIHTYPSIQSNNNWMSTSQVEQQNQDQVSLLTNYFHTQKGYPVIIGEWGTSNVDASTKDCDANPTLYQHFVRDFLTRCKNANIATFYWMGLSEGTHRSVPEFNQSDIVSVMQSVYPKQTQTDTTPTNPSTVTEFETASQAVINMGYGWNLGNSLESNSGSVTNMWIENYTSRTPSNYETAWNQPVTTQALIHMFKEAGYGVIRVPVTWYPHMGINTNGLNWDKQNWNPSAVDAAWMARVKEVVDYVINEGMYCILNVHHDTGTNNTAWIRASMNSYNQMNSTFTALWTQIANTFKNYDEHLIFEGYNEMMDEYNSWCYASKDAGSNYYDASVATDSYNAINSYANAFVSAVRATGGNNTYRNLLVNTYCAANGMGTWSTHTVDPLVNLNMPTDPCGNQNHLFAGIHTYLSLQDNGQWMTNTQVDQQNQTQIGLLTNYLQQQKGYPVIVGEWGSSNVDATTTDYDANNTLYQHYVQDFLTRCKNANIVPIYWMGLSDGTHRSIPEFNQSDLVTIMQGVYANTGTGVEETVNSSTAVKILLDGKIVIIKDGRAYNALGQLISK